MSNPVFSFLFKRYRLRSEFTTLSAFAEALVEEGVIFEDSLFSHWQTGDRIPRNRKTILALIRLFHKKHALQTLEEANDLMESVGLGYLTDDEKNILFIGILKQKPGKANHLLKTIEYSYNPLTLIEEQIDNYFEPIYLGYDSSFKYLGKMKKLIYDLKLDKTKKGINALSRINWARIDSLFCKAEPKDYVRYVSMSEAPILFAKENSTHELGQTLYMKFKTKRLELLMRSTCKIVQSEIDECIRLAEFGLSLIPKTKIADRLRATYALAELGLFLRDRSLFEKNLFSCFNLFDQLPQSMQYLKTRPWAIKALGNIRFDENKISALKNIQVAISCAPRSYQLLHLSCQVDILHIFLNSKDLQHHYLADKLRKELLIKNTILGDHFEDARIKQKRLIGLA